MSSYQKSDLTFFARERADGRYGFWWLADSATWAAAKNDLRASFPHHTGLKYDGQAREWTVPRYSVERLQRWADAWAGRQEWDARPRGGQQGYARGSEGTPDASLSSAYRELHLLPSAPPELVTAAYRTLAQLHHPDHGGDTGAMVALNAAVDVIREGQGLQARAS